MEWDSGLTPVPGASRPDGSVALCDCAHRTTRVPRPKRQSTNSSRPRTGCHSFALDANPTTVWSLNLSATVSVNPESDRYDTSDTSSETFTAPYSTRSFFAGFGVDDAVAPESLGAAFTSRHS